MFCFMFPGMQKVGVQSVPVPSKLWRRPLLGPNCGLPDSLVQMTTVSTPETPSPCGPISLAGPGPTGTLRRLCNEVNFFLRYHIPDYKTTAVVFCRHCIVVASSKHVHTTRAHSPSVTRFFALRHGEVTRMHHGNLPVKPQISQTPRKSVS